MCVDAGTICLPILKGLQSSMNWRRRSNSTSQLPTHHTGELVLMTNLRVYTEIG